MDDGPALDPLGPTQASVETPRWGIAAGIVLGLVLAGVGLREANEGRDTGVIFALGVVLVGVAVALALRPNRLEITDFGFRERTLLIGPRTFWWHECGEFEVINTGDAAAVAFVHEQSGVTIALLSVYGQMPTELAQWMNEWRRFGRGERVLKPERGEP